MRIRKALVLVLISTLALAGTLIGLSLYGIDIPATLLGTPWRSRLPDDRTAMAIQGGIVTITILFGSLLIAGIIALAVKNDKPKQTKDSPGANLESSCRGGRG